METSNIDPNKVYISIIDEDRNPVTGVSLSKEGLNNGTLGRAIKRLMEQAKEENVDIRKHNVVVYSSQEELDAIKYF